MGSGSSTTRRRPAAAADGGEDREGDADPEGARGEDAPREATDGPAGDAGSREEVPRDAEGEPRHRDENAADAANLAGPRRAQAGAGKSRWTNFQRAVGVSLAFRRRGGAGGGPGRDGDGEVEGE